MRVSNPVIKQALNRIGFFQSMEQSAVAASNTMMPIVFVHVPKCGGSALREALLKVCGPRATTIDSRASRKATQMPLQQDVATGMALTHRDCFPQLVAILGYLLYDDYDFVHGHVPVNRHLMDEFAESHQFVTVLRDPVERWISNYRFDKVRNLKPERLPWRDNTGQLKDELMQVIRSDRGIELARIYTWMLGGIEGGEIGSAGAIEVAKQNLSKFSYVCTSEDWTPLIDRFQQRHNVTIQPVIRNTTSSRELDSGRAYDVRGAIDDEVIGELEAICSQDREIYDFCKTLCTDNATDYLST